MNRVKQAIRNFVSNEDGAALAEYGILIAFIAVAAIVAVTFFGGKIKEKFSEYGNSLNLIYAGPYRSEPAFLQSAHRVMGCKRGCFAGAVQFS